MEFHTKKKQESKYAIGIMLLDTGVFDEFKVKIFDILLFRFDEYKTFIYYGDNQDNIHHNTPFQNTHGY